MRSNAPTLPDRGRMRILSFGAGVQTTALAILAAKREIEPYDALVFADTGGEHPETYAYLERVFKPWDKGLFHSVQVVSPKWGTPTLYDYAYRRRMVPSIINRWCTNQFKIRPIKKFLRPLAPGTISIGISADESHRAVRRPQPRGIEPDWPLVSLSLTREDCRRIIANAGLPEPRKSGCWFCPFQSRRNWLELAELHPDLWGKALALEANSIARNPRDFLGSDKPVAKLLSEGRQPFLDGFLEAESGCRSGYCFV